MNGKSPLLPKPMNGISPSSEISIPIATPARSSSTWRTWADYTFLSQIKTNGPAFAIAMTAPKSMATPFSGKC